MQSDFADYYRQQAEAGAPSASDPDTAYLLDILLDVVHASGHSLEYVYGTMPWRKMWAIHFSIKRKRDRLREAAENNPLASLALMLSYGGL